MVQKWLEPPTSVGYQRLNMPSVGAGTGQIKTGAPCRSERLAKYNQLNPGSGWWGWWHGIWVATTHHGRVGNRVDFQQSFQLSQEGFDQFNSL